jgi:hypothetical protein
MDPVACVEAALVKVNWKELGVESDPLYAKNELAGMYVI